MENETYELDRKELDEVAKKANDAADEAVRKWVEDNLPIPSSRARGNVLTMATWLLTIEGVENKRKKTLKDFYKSYLSGGATVTGSIEVNTYERRGIPTTLGYFGPQQAKSFEDFAIKIAEALCSRTSSDEVVEASRLSWGVLIQRVAKGSDHIAPLFEYKPVRSFGRGTPSDYDIVVQALIALGKGREIAAVRKEAYEEVSKEETKALLEDPIRRDRLAKNARDRARLVKIGKATGTAASALGRLMSKKN